MEYDVRFVGDFERLIFVKRFIRLTADDVDDDSFFSFFSVDSLVEDVDLLGISGEHSSRC